MKRVELLAPAKDKNTAFTAINCGCDALYAGAISFGARKKAGNSIDDIKEIVSYAHKFYVRVYVTINTILDDEELVEAQRLIEKLYNIGVDAIIVQDAGIIKLALEGKIPPIEIHASTQCNNRTIEKVKFFSDMGISRIILARELSLEEIKFICQSVSADIETFIHGALCVSYSGQCYMSYHIGGRSANRGECAQACRKKYSLMNDKGKYFAKDKYLLSMKDFNASKYLKKLIDAGVKSFKIEGRLKDANYVKNVTAYYRNEIDKYALKTSSGKVFLDFEPDVHKSFNRGFTDYFLNGREKCYNFESPKSIGEKLGIIEKVSDKYFTIKGLKHKLHPQDGLFFDGKGCLINRIDGNKIFPNKIDGIISGKTIYRNFDFEYEKKLLNSKTKRRIAVKFYYKNNILTAVDEDRNVSEIKIEYSEAAKNPNKMKEIFHNQLSKTGESDFYIENIEIEGSIPFLQISKINELRRDILTKLMTERLKNYPKILQKPLKTVKFPDKKLDYKANIHNKKAKEFYEACGCEVCSMSYESGGFADELMRTKHCIKYAFNMCKSPEKLFLADEKGIKYPLEFDCKNCEMIIKNCK